jgi:hypothetical protein
MTQALQPSFYFDCHVREGHELLERGPYPDRRPQSYHLFELEINR